MASVTLKKIGKFYDKTSVLQDIDLDIQDGEFVVFVGPSGCGKSTLLRMIAGLEDISAGELLIGDDVMNQVPPSKRGIAMVFQSYALYPHMSLYDNMAFGLKIAGKSKSEIDVAVRSAARVLDIEHLLDRKPRALSGGQRQRVAIGRAITRQPKVFLFDEPLSNLDAALRVQMRLEFARLHAELATTMIYVTHDQIEAMTLADKIVVLAGGRIEQVGSPSTLYHHPANQFVAGFIGSPKMNFLNAVVQSADASGVVLHLPGGSVQRAAVNGVTLTRGQNVTLGVRPEHVHLVSPSAGIESFPAKTRALESLGDFSYLYADCEATGDAVLIIRVADGVRPRNGDLLKVAADPEKCHVFDASGLALPRIMAQQETVQPFTHDLTAPVTA